MPALALPRFLSRSARIVGIRWTPYRVRRNAWWAILCGACGYRTGTRLWRFEPNWREVLNVRSSQQAPLIRRFLESRPWWRLIPDTKHEPVTAGFGQWKQADHVAAAQADDRSLAIAYLPNGGAIQVALDCFPRSVAAAWFDPTSGQYWFVEGSPFPANTKRDFTPARMPLASRIGRWFSRSPHDAERLSGPEHNVTRSGPHCSFDLGGRRLFDQLDAEERKVLGEASAIAGGADSAAIYPVKVGPAGRYLFGPAQPAAFARV